MDIKLYTTMDFLPDAQIRDRDNDHPESDPIDLVWGVHSRLIFVLFRGRDYGTEPFQLPDDIASWTWMVDSDFDRSTPPLIEGDNAEIEAVETDTETKIIVPFTVNGARLESSLVGRSYIDDLTGELLGLSSDGDIRFIMQVPGLMCRNRIG